MTRLQHTGQGPLPGEGGSRGSPEKQSDGGFTRLQKAFHCEAHVVTRTENPKGYPLQGEDQERRACHQPTSEGPRPGSVSVPGREKTDVPARAASGYPPATFLLGRPPTDGGEAAHRRRGARPHACGPSLRSSPIQKSLSSRRASPDTQKSCFPGHLGTPSPVGLTRKRSHHRQRRAEVARLTELPNQVRRSVTADTVLLAVKTAHRGGRGGDRVGHDLILGNGFLHTFT